MHFPRHSVLAMLQAQHGSPSRESRAQELSKTSNHGKSVIAPKFVS
jgi:hypothetical protein